MSVENSHPETKELIRHSVDVLSVLDESGIIQYESPSFSQMFGYDPSDVIGDSVFEYVHPDDRQKAMDTFTEVTEHSPGYTTGSVELRFRHKDDGWVWVESRGSNEMGSAIGGYVITSRDISKRKEYERQLKQERDRFERFVSVVSHDLRSPLSVAEGCIELVRNDYDSEDLDAAADAIQRCHALVNDLLSLAREGDDLDDIELVTLEEVAETSWMNIETPEATLDTDVDTIIRADRNRLQQLLENLYRNAVEHGGDEVTMTVGALTDGFYIEDNGSGIPEDKRDKIFDMGYSTTERGTGFGLSIVQQIADAHGWDVKIAEGNTGGARIEITGVEINSTAE